MEDRLTPYKSPRQKRSRESLERLLDSAEQQIRENGFESLTVSGVVSNIGLSVGAFYARFPDKTALIYSLQHRFHERLERKIHQEMLQEAGTQATLADTVNAAVDVLIRNVLGERELSRAFMTLSVTDPVLREGGQRVNQERREVFAEVVMPHADEIGHGDARLAVDIAYGMYAAVTRGRLVFGAEHELYYGIDSLTLYRELKKALVLYLKGGGNLP